MIGGVDTHKHTHYAGVIDDQGRLLGHQEFEATDAGYCQLLAWMRSHGEVRSIGVESTGSFGATLTRYLTAAGVEVIEVNRPNRLARRMDGKSDQLDAEQIARAVLGQTSTAVPKAKSGIVEVIRTLRVTRSSAVKARTQAFNTLWGVMIGAPSPLRDELVALTKRTLVNRCLGLRPETDDLLSLAGDPQRLLTAGIKTALRDLARRWKTLDEEIKALNKNIASLVRSAAPELVELHGVGVEIAGQFLVTAGDNPERIHSEAAFAKLCGVAPQPASSGRTTGRHRLSRSGDRAANSALYIITIVRMRHHQPTRDYVERRTAEGRTKREIIRCLKRYIAREIFNNLPATTRSAPPASEPRTTP
ncbi:MAG TPA: IS110 family transposase [Jiangellaceae bacterium]|nr:IS110 family transposase [Jiangellaceae bacterium]